MFFSLTGTWIQAVAQSWLVFQLTGSAFLLGVVGFLSTIPVFLLSLFGGVLADRVNKRKILLVTQTAFMCLAFFLAVEIQRNTITTGHIMAAALLNGLVMAFDAPCRQAVVVELVGKKNLVNAIAMNSVAFNSSRVIGPALAGILVSTIGMSGCFYINGFSFLAVLCALFLVKVHDTRKRGKSSAFADLADGMRFIRQHRIIMVLIAMVAAVSLFGVSYVILMPIFANEILHVGMRGLGMLMSSAGIGALAGALLLARLSEYAYKRKFLIAACFIFSFSLICFSLSTDFVFSLFILGSMGASSVFALSLINIFLQHKVPDEYRGRVMGVFMLTFAGMMPFGNLFCGAVSHFLGVSYTVFLSGIMCACIFLSLSVFSRWFEALDKFSRAQKN